MGGGINSTTVIYAGGGEGGLQLEPLSNRPLPTKRDPEKTIYQQEVGGEGEGNR